VPRETLAAFGLALYRLRAARRWPLRRAAREAGVSVTTVMEAEPSGDACFCGRRDDHEHQLICDDCGAPWMEGHACAATMS
jgi:hypothetical protein